MLVVIESAMYPDATDDVVLAILEGRGLRAGRDFFLATAPQRIAPANPLVTRRSIPKVIGGITNDCRRLASALYGTVVDSIVSVSSTRAAEMVHLLEATFRTVNTALANELALLCDRMELDVWEVIAAARTKPFDFMPFYPGPGTGGCETPVGGGRWNCLSTASGELRLIDVAERVNATMPFAVVDLITEALASQAQTIRGASLLFAGVSDRRLMDETDSAALSVMTLLAARGAQISYSDPQVATVPASAWGGGSQLESIPLTPTTLVEADCVVILTDHIGCAADNIVLHSRLVVDARNVTGCDDRKIFRLGASHRRASLRQIRLPGPQAARPKRSLPKSRSSRS
jgi:UDP-N-acetyl-D-glucosamine dehydrogenase